MSSVLAIIVSIILIAIAGIHLYWGFGGFWPGRDEASLVDMVVGARPGTPMPPLIACVLVASCLAVSALSVLSVSGVFTLPLLRYLRWMWGFAFWFSCAVFLLRGAITYVAGNAVFAPGTAFVTLNQLYYSPLCLVLGGLFLAIRFLPKAVG